MRKLTSFSRRYVPVVHQLHPLECGVACLAMILGYYHYQVDSTDCRERCGIGRAGTSVGALLRAARSYGLAAHVVTIQHAEDIGRLPLPAIVHWKPHHFIVIERVTSRGVVVVDPAIGRRRLTSNEFATGFSGIVLTCVPGQAFTARCRPRSSIWHSYLHSILRTPWVLAHIFVASLLLQLLVLALPFITRMVFDEILPWRIRDVMPVLAIGMALLVVVQMFISFARSQLVIALQTRVDRELMTTFFGHMLTLPWRFFQQRASGDLLMRLSSNTLIREILTTQAISVILDGTLAIVSLIILVITAPLFALITLLLGGIQIIIVVGLGAKLHTLSQHDLSAQAELQAYTVEVLSGMLAIKAAGTEARALNHWSALFANQLATSVRKNRLSTTVDTIVSGVRTSVPFICVWIGAQYVLDGVLTLGTMLALNMLVGAVLQPMSSLVAQAQRLQLLGANLERLADVLDAPPEQITEGKKRSDVQLTGHIELRNVSFRYDSGEPLVLHNISLTIEPGKKVALVGSTGSGKSTVAKLLLGLYEPTEGDICYDDIPLPQLDYRTVRNQCGVVLQEPIVFSGTIAENIAFNDASIDLEAIRAAATIAEIDGEIQQLPQRYQTQLLEHGRGFSGGQLQRLAIARAVAHHPTILILDEATSHLDTATEARVVDNLSHFACTQIVIAHRLSTICNGDWIVVLEEGCIVEQGTHVDLLAQQGHYAELVQQQIISDDGLGLAEMSSRGRTQVGHPA